MEKVKHEWNGLFCKPRARCFKGISILTLIFSVCCVLMAVIIGPVIKVHGDTTINHNTKKGEPTAAEVADRLSIMTQTTVWLSVVFIVTSLISLALFFKYQKKERAQVGENDDFIQTTNNYSGVPE